jgi:excisionase family DNA binding protein
MQATDAGIAIADDGPLLWDVRATARALGVSSSLLYRMARRREIPSLKISNRLRFNPADVEAWVHARTTTCVGE